MGKMSIVDRHLWRLMLIRATAFAVIGWAILGWSVYRFINPVTPLVELPFGKLFYPIAILVMGIGFLLVAVHYVAEAESYKK